MRPRSQEGQATIELALLLPVLILLFAALVQIGVVTSDHVRLWHAAREAVRVAVVDDDAEAIRAAAERSGLDGLELGVNPPPQGRVRGEPLTVSLSYRPAASIPVVGAVLSGIVMRVSATMRIEQP